MTRTSQGPGGRVPTRQGSAAPSLQSAADEEEDAQQDEGVTALGHGSLGAWKEHHAFGLGLDKALEDFPTGAYAFYFCGAALLAALDAPDGEQRLAAASLETTEPETSPMREHGWGLVVVDASLDARRS